MHTLSLGRLLASSSDGEKSDESESCDTGTHEVPGTSRDLRWNLSQSSSVPTSTDYVETVTSDLTLPFLEETLEEASAAPSTASPHAAIPELGTAGERKLVKRKSCENAHLEREAKVLRIGEPAQPTPAEFQPPALPQGFDTLVDSMLHGSEDALSELAWLLDDVTTSLTPPAFEGEHTPPTGESVNQQSLHSLSPVQQVSPGLSGDTTILEGGNWMDSTPLSPFSSVLSEASHRTSSAPFDEWLLSEEASSPREALDVTGSSGTPSAVPCSGEEPKEMAKSHRPLSAATAQGQMDLAELSTGVTPQTVSLGELTLRPAQMWLLTPVLRPYLPPDQGVTANALDAPVLRSLLLSTPHKRRIRPSSVTAAEASRRRSEPAEQRGSFAAPEVSQSPSSIQVVQGPAYVPLQAPATASFMPAQQVLGAMPLDLSTLASLLPSATQNSATAISLDTGVGGWVQRSGPAEQGPAQVSLQAPATEPSTAAEQGLGAKPLDLAALASLLLSAPDESTIEISSETRVEGSGQRSEPAEQMGVFAAPEVSQGPSSIDVMEGPAQVSHQAPATEPCTAAEQGLGAKPLDLAALASLLLSAPDESTIEISSETRVEGSGQRSEPAEQMGVFAAPEVSQGPSSIDVMEGPAPPGSHQAPATEPCTAAEQGLGAKPLDLAALASLLLSAPDESTIEISSETRVEGSGQRSEPAEQMGVFAAPEVSQGPSSIDVMEGSAQVSLQAPATEPCTAAGQGLGATPLDLAALASLLSSPSEASAIGISSETRVEGSEQRSGPAEQMGVFAAPEVSQGPSSIDVMEGPAQVSLRAPATEPCTAAEQGLGATPPDLAALASLLLSAPDESTVGTSSETRVEGSEQRSGPAEQMGVFAAPEVSQGPSSIDVMEGPAQVSLQAPATEPCTAAEQGLGAKPLESPTPAGVLPSASESGNIRNSSDTRAEASERSSEQTVEEVGFFCVPQHRCSKPHGGLGCEDCLSVFLSATVIAYEARLAATAALRIEICIRMQGSVVIVVCFVQTLSERAESATEILFSSLTWLKQMLKGIPEEVIKMHPFYRHPGKQQYPGRRTFSHANATLSHTSHAAIIPLLSECRSLLKKLQLTKEELQVLLGYVERLCGYASNRMPAHGGGITTTFAVQTLGRVFMIIDTLYCASEVLADVSKRADWWPNIVDHIENARYPNKSRDQILQRVCWSAPVLNALNVALDYYRKGLRPPPILVVAIKSALLLSPMASDFKHAKWNDWRTDAIEWLTLMKSRRREIQQLNKGAEGRRL
ncbi:GK22061, related [Eimeria brunetti]|uniref:GK22061, related n=1 Tax=Eimeria brunetti TaxID=51314 RepID=U6LHH8_9EIME|nr:GK22061, related [Eimeria brunetti]